MITDLQVISFLAEKEMMENRVREIVKIIGDIDRIPEWSGQDIFDIDLCQGEAMVTVHWTVYGACSYRAEECYNFPMDFLSMSDDEIKVAVHAEFERKVNKALEDEKKKKELVAARIKGSKQRQLDKLLAEKEQGAF